MQQCNGLPWLCGSSLEERRCQLVADVRAGDKSTEAVIQQRTGATISTVSAQQRIVGEGIGSWASRSAEGGGWRREESRACGEAVGVRLWGRG